LYSYMWKFSKGFHSLIIFQNILFTIANIIDAISPLILAALLNSIQKYGVSQENIWFLMGMLGLMLLTELGFWAFHGPARVIESNNAFKIQANYKNYLLQGITKLPASWHTINHSGDTIDKVEQSSRALYDFSAQSYEITQFIVKFTTAYIALIYFNIQATYISLIFIFGVFYSIKTFDKKIIPRYKQQNKFGNKISEKIYDTISNIITVIILRIRKPLLKIIGKSINDPREYHLKTNKLNEFKWFVTSLFVLGMSITIIGTYIWASLKNGNIVMVGTISALFGYSSRIGGEFYRFTFKYGQLTRYRTRITNAEEISNNFIEKNFITKEIKLTNWKKIQVNTLNFTYEDEENKNKKHLDGINFFIKRKSRIAFIGASGSGKTTALKIIRELYAANDYEILLDGKILKNGLGKLQNNISLIPQEPELFSTTIRNNITLEIPCNTKKLMKYVELAKFSEVVKKLPRGLNSSIREKGVNLSGGEKQRLALARGLLASENKEIILLDEPTSSVDPKTELEIHKAVFTEFKNKTIISSIHRLHLLPLFDHIYLFKGGKIIGDGKYNDLKKTSETFQIMLKKYQQSEIRKELKKIKN